MKTILCDNNQEEYRGVFKTITVDSRYVVGPHRKLKFAVHFACAGRVQVVVQDPIGKIVATQTRDHGSLFFAMKIKEPGFYSIYLKPIFISRDSEYRLRFYNHTENIFLMIDCGKLMTSKAMEESRSEIEKILSACRMCPYRLESSLISVIAFDKTGVKPFPPMDLTEFKLPLIQSNPNNETNFSEAIKTLMSAIEDSLVLPITPYESDIGTFDDENRGDLPPIIFIFSNFLFGENFQMQKEYFSKMTVVACVVGSERNVDVARKATNIVLDVSGTDVPGYRAIFPIYD
jgi:uncharacterized protein YegL